MKTYFFTLLTLGLTLTANAQVQNPNQEKNSTYPQNANGVAQDTLKSTEVLIPTEVTAQERAAQKAQEDKAKQEKAAQKAQEERAKQEKELAKAEQTKLKAQQKAEKEKAKQEKQAIQQAKKEAQAAKKAAK